jgi:phage baseplate assembly protein W
MARPSISINPIDLPENEQVAVGVTFPFNRGGVFGQSFTTKEQIKSNLINLLLTDRGERINQLDFGIGIKRLIFEQKVDVEELKRKINQGSEIFIPEIELIDILVEKDPNSHTLRIVISYRILLDYDQDTIELNFS